MEPDELTIVDVDVDHLAHVPVDHRSDPQLHWTDASGSHTYVIGGRTLLGSAAGVDIVVNAQTVSRLHAALEPADDGLWIRDLGSRNGTYVGGIRVAFARVPDGGQIRLGSAELILRYDQQETEVARWPTEKFGPMVGRSAIMREMFARLQRIAQSDSTVLIHGETGTGKELVARAIHEASPRKGKPFVVVDCGALPESLLEAELFGHAKGAFTGAASARAGAIEAADGGTVFLDEIGEMPLSMQPKLLRAIEGHTVRRIGETAYRDMNVRYLCATHRDLPSMVNSGAFREDLYFRLAVLPVNVPPLRAHSEDIPLLAQSFLPVTAQGALTQELLAELQSRPWLGNVRELRNFVERALALGTREALAMGRMPAGPNGNGHGSTTGQHRAASEELPSVPIEEHFKAVRDRWLDHLEREYMRGMVSKFNRDTNAISQASGLDRSYVYRLIRKHEL